MWAKPELKIWTIDKFELANFVNVYTNKFTLHSGICFK